MLNKRKRPIKTLQSAYVYIDTWTPRHYEKVTPEDLANMIKIPTKIEKQKEFLKLFVNGREIATLSTLRGRAHKQRKRERRG